MILQRLRRNRRMPLEQRLFENKDRHWIFVAGLTLVGLIAINQLIRLTHPDLSPLEGWVSALAAVSAIVVLAPSRALGGSSAVIALTVLALYVLGIWVWPQPRDDATVVIQLLFLGGVLALAHVVAVGRSKRTAHGMRDEEQAHWLLTLRQSEPRIHYEIARSRRYERPLSLILLVWSKGTAGQRAAATDLRLEQLLQPNIRRIDFGLRLDAADRLAVMCPETDATAAKVCADRLQVMLRRELALPVDCAVAAFPDHAVTFQGLLDHAERQLQAPSCIPSTPRGTGGAPEHTAERLTG